MTDPNNEQLAAEIDSILRHNVPPYTLDFSKVTNKMITAEIMKLIARATREAWREELKKLSWAVVESCEPECNAVRHARHEGTWNAHLIIEERLAVLDSGEGE